jgi:hypothetical protein
MHSGGLNPMLIGLRNGMVTSRSGGGLPTENLLLHFDAIDNAGVGTHSSSTTEWVNLAPATSNDFYLSRGLGSWEDNAAVFTGMYDECFWLNDYSGRVSNLFSTLGVGDDSSWTYAIAVYYDPATIQSFRGYYGQQAGGSSGSYEIYLRTDIQVSWILMGKKAGGATTGSQDCYFEGHAPNFKDYLTEYTFNTIVATWDVATATFNVYING